jgi:hypothetical protein
MRGSGWITAVARTSQEQQGVKKQAPPCCQARPILKKRLHWPAHEPLEKWIVYWQNKPLIIDLHHIHPLWVIFSDHIWKSVEDTLWGLSARPYSLGIDVYQEYLWQKHLFWLEMNSCFFWRFFSTSRALLSFEHCEAMHVGYKFLILKYL